MGDDGSLDNAIECNIENVTGTQAITSSAEGGDTARLETCNDLVERGTSLVSAVRFEPLLNRFLSNCLKNNLNTKGKLSLVPRPDLP